MSTESNLIYFLLIFVQLIIKYFIIVESSQCISGAINFMPFWIFWQQCSPVQKMSSAFLHLWVHHIANYTIPYQMWVGHTLANVGLSHLTFSFSGGSAIFYYLLHMGSATFNFLILNWVYHFSILFFTCGPPIVETTLFSPFLCSNNEFSFPSLLGQPHNELHYSPSLVGLPNCENLSGLRCFCHLYLFSICGSTTHSNITSCRYSKCQITLYYFYLCGSVTLKIIFLKHIFMWLPLWQ